MKTVEIRRHFFRMLTTKIVNNNFSRVVYGKRDSFICIIKQKIFPQKYFTLRLERKFLELQELL